MSGSLPCPYLGGDIELTDERERHITAQHPDLLPTHSDLLASTLAEPDLVRQSIHAPSARLFSRWYPQVRSGRFVVVVVVSDTYSSRHWIVTAYSARRLSGGVVLWERS